MATPFPFPVIFLLVLLFLSTNSLANGDHRRRQSSRYVPRFMGKFSQLHKHSNRIQQYEYQTRYFDQQLDHFSFAMLPSFRQRYLINTKHWVGPSRLGPIFFYCGNEGDIEWFAANTGFVWELAPQFGAMVIFPEVRTNTVCPFSCFKLDKNFDLCLGRQRLILIFFSGV